LLATASYSAIVGMHDGRAFERRGIGMFTAEVLPGNVPMLKVFEQSGLSIDRTVSLKVCV